MSACVRYARAFDRGATGPLPQCRLAAVFVDVWCGVVWVRYCMMYDRDGQSVAVYMMYVVSGYRRVAVWVYDVACVAASVVWLCCVRGGGWVSSQRRHVCLSADEYDDRRAPGTCNIHKAIGSVGPVLLRTPPKDGPLRLLLLYLYIGDRARLWGRLVTKCQRWWLYAAPVPRLTIERPIF